MFNYLYFAKSRAVYPAVLGDLLVSLWWLIYYDVKVREKKSCLLVHYIWALFVLSLWFALISLSVSKDCVILSLPSAFHSKLSEGVMASRYFNAWLVEIANLILNTLWH